MRKRTPERRRATEEDGETESRPASKPGQDKRATVSHDQRMNALAAIQERQQPARIVDALERARDYLNVHLFEALTLPRLAEAAGLSAYHFTRQFSARFGASPMAYVRHRRLTAAASRLCSDAAPSLVDLAFDCGFDSQEGFTRAFKRVFGEGGALRLFA